MVVNNETKSRYPAFAKIVEVSPRDGLQNEKEPISSKIKIDFINMLSNTGLRSIETTSFVSPQWVPQMSDHSQVYESINKTKGVSYSVLVPNLIGLNNALKVGVEEIAVFAAASEAFNKKNTNCSLSQCLARIETVTKQALSHGLRVRGYISCCLGCPYEGEIPPERVSQIAERLYKMGCYEISLADTIGTGNPRTMRNLIEKVSEKIPTETIAVHCHDTYGQALPNILTALECGVAVFDSSVAGLGGCPFAKGSNGNVATEDVVHMLEGMGIKTNVEMDSLIKAGQFICKALKRQTCSKVTQALTSD